MTSKLQTLVKGRTEETKVLYLFVFLGILGSAWLIYHFAQFAMLEIPLLIP